MRGTSDSKKKKSECWSRVSKQQQQKPVKEKEKGYENLLTWEENANFHGHHSCWYNWQESHPLRQSKDPSSNPSCHNRVFFPSLPQHTNKVKIKPTFIINQTKTTAYVFFLISHTHKQTNTFKWVSEIPVLHTQFKPGSGYDINLEGFKV